MRRWSLDRRPWATVVGVIFLAAIPSLAPARPIAFGFEGIVTEVFDGLGTLPASVTPGSSYAGFYVFNSNAPNTGEPYGEGEQGIYHHVAAPLRHGRPGRRNPLPSGVP